MPQTTEPEPWLRGPLSGAPLHVMPVFFSFAQVREDLARNTEGIADEQAWQLIAGKHSLGFHLKHIAGSVDRLATYTMGNQLSEAQLEFLKREHATDSTLSDLLKLVDESLASAGRQFLQLAPEALFEAREVGRKHLPTTVFGLLVHVCEHTQRHLGQAILICRILQP